LILAGGLTLGWSSPITLTQVELYTGADYSTYSPTPDLPSLGHTTNGLDWYTDETRTALPLGTSSQTSAIKRSLTTNTYTYQDGADDFSFAVDFLARHDASHWSLSSSYGSLYFDVSADMAFTIAGEFNMAPGSTPDAHIFNGGIYDLTTGQWIYYSSQHSRNTASEAFTLGQNGGDYANTLIQSGSYDLLAGHQYQVYYATWNQADPYAAEGNASGYFSFSAHSVNPAPEAVPEPGTLALSGLGLAFLAGAAIRKRLRATA
jgi:hypothetical protein